MNWCIEIVKQVPIFFSLSASLTSTTLEITPVLSTGALLLFTPVGYWARAWMIWAREHVFNWALALLRNLGLGTVRCVHITKMIQTYQALALV